MVRPEHCSEPVDAYLALGSNLGDREAHLASALAGLRATPGLQVTAVSGVYETEPVGPAPQGPNPERRPTVLGDTAGNGR